jgi:predicted Fe-Mo cluster-binding NifX family protein
MRIAIPVDGGHLARHFGHCRKFALIDVDPAGKRITGTSEIAAPEHQPGLLPPWLKERGVDVVIAGGMGDRAHSLFQAAAIEVLTGAPEESPAALVEQYLSGGLASSGSLCDHSEHTGPRHVSTCEPQ